MQGLMQAVFDIDLPILGTLVKTETTIKHNSSILSDQQQCEHNNEKIKNKCNV